MLHDRMDDSAFFINLIKVKLDPVNSGTNH